jgi:hypothetical protein
VILLHRDDSERSGWMMLGKLKFHTKPICDILFIQQPNPILKSSPKPLPRLISLAEDRVSSLLSLINFQINFCNDEVFFVMNNSRILLGKCCFFQLLFFLHFLFIAAHCGIRFIRVCERNCRSRDSIQQTNLSVCNPCVNELNF